MIFSHITEFSKDLSSFFYFSNYIVKKEAFGGVVFDP